MIGLAIHTTSPELGLALVDLKTQQRRSQVWPLGRGLTTYLHTCLQEFILPYTWQNIAFLAVAKGPGGFTGTRIGVVVARTLAQQVSCPLFGISSLAAIAQQYHETHPSDSQPSPLAVTLRAQRGEQFGAIYQRHSEGITVALPEALYAAADWQARLRHWPHSCQVLSAEGGLATTVTAVLTLAQQQWAAGDRPDWQTVLPFYGQHPVQQPSS